MNIIKNNFGTIMIEQYGNKYIRYDAGQISDCILQVKITEEEYERVLNDEITMESVVNWYSNRGLCSEDKLRNDLIADYLSSTGKYSEKRQTEIIEKLNKYRDLFFEFYDYILDEQFVKDDVAIKIEGFTAKSLATKYPLSPLGAYNYLIYLRETPQKALADLGAGLKRK